VGQEPSGIGTKPRKIMKILKKVLLVIIITWACLFFAVLLLPDEEGGECFADGGAYGGPRIFKFKDLDKIIKLTSIYCSDGFNDENFKRHSITITSWKNIQKTGIQKFPFCSGPVSKVLRIDSQIIFLSRERRPLTYDVHENKFLKNDDWDCEW